MPDATGIGAPLAEILPIQLLTLHLANELGVEAGKFRHIGKVTLSE
jgi:glucosamine 6-phosphate synthetase-like amidotransferase/phosphosugar isomerase protein